jgi:prepilin-type N-terminal cleavage/methylation domain-containing protein
MSPTLLRRSRLRHRRGFTLVELLVATVAGLIVGLAVVALSKEATNTFHEESRTAAAEMALRVAMDRIRADIGRASFMSTPNIWRDPSIAVAPGQPKVPPTAASPQLRALQGIRIVPRPDVGSRMPLCALNGLNPQAIEVTGNMTGADVYAVRKVEEGGSCAGQRVELITDTPAMWRVLGTPDPQQTLRGYFQPVAGQPFLIRVQDITGGTQYVPLCAGPDAVKITGSGAAAIVTVDVSNAGGVKILTAKDTQGNKGLSGFGSGTLSINPVHTVRWEIRELDASTPRDQGYVPLDIAASDAGAGGKYDLVRAFVDIGADVGAFEGTVGPAEVVAEYAVDLRFAVSADLDVPSLATRSLTSYGFDQAENESTTAAVAESGLSRPERVRSVRVRLSTRAAVADRTVGLVAPQANPLQTSYPLRFCTDAAHCTDGRPVWARVRTVTTEIALANQSRVFW